MSCSWVCSSAGPAGALVPRGGRAGGGRSDPAGHAAPAALASAEGVVAAEEGNAGEVDVHVDRVLAGGRTDDVDQPGVERVARAGRQLLRPGLDRLGQPQGDPGDITLLLDL